MKIEIGRFTFVATLTVADSKAEIAAKAPMATYTGRRQFDDFDGVYLFDEVDGEVLAFLNMDQLWRVLRRLLVVTGQQSWDFARSEQTRTKDALLTYIRSNFTNAAILDAVKTLKIRC